MSLFLKIILGEIFGFRVHPGLKQEKKFWQALFKNKKIGHFYFGNNRTFLF